MNTRPYSDLLGLVEALCGATLADQERARVRYFVNRRAQRAYAETELWPRFLIVGQERLVSESGLLPYEQDNLDDIGTVLRVHATQPFLSDPAREYGEFYAASTGIQITGYQAAEASTGADMIVTGSLNPDFTGTYSVFGYETGQHGTVYPKYRSNSNSTHEILPSIASVGGADKVAWYFGSFPIGDYWITDVVENYATPADGSLNYIPGGDATGDPVVTAETIYSAYITYKAALAATYGTNDGDTTEFPEEWFDYAAHGAYADFLRNEGQQDKAALAEVEANDILQQQLEKVCRQGGARIFTRTMNHGNHQAR